jgi:glycosyltransferase involved in cell wall biosynthesis
MTPVTPKISLVTPCLDQASTLGAAMDSVLDQNYSELEYVVIDGGSTDGSVATIEQHSSRLAYWVSEPDDGHYPAVNKGFAKTTGEIMGYLNSDDLLLPGSLSLIAELFTAFPAIEWITGAYMAIDDVGRPVGVNIPSRWSRWHLIVAGAGRSVPQEATFWRRSLWERAGGGLDETFSLAADYELWVRFARHAQLTTVRAPLACFRHMTGQRSVALGERYAEEVARIRARERALEPRVDKAARSAERLLRFARRPGFDRVRPIVDSVLGAPRELVFDPGSRAFYPRDHTGRGARIMYRVLSGLAGRSFRDDKK